VTAVLVWADFLAVFFHTPVCVSLIVAMVEQICSMDIGLYASHTSLGVCLVQPLSSYNRSRCMEISHRWTALFLSIP
jgi:hypothetical protein